MTTRSADLAAALTEAARAISTPSSLGETLDAIVATVVLSLPEFSHAGISTTHRDGRIETMAGTDQLVWELDSLQYSMDQGPCVDAARSENVVTVEHARHDQRWPDYMPRAVERGLRAQLGLRLYDDRGTIGTLNLYSTDSETIDPDSLQLATLFADHAAIALGHALTEDQLHQAMTWRKTIGQALGIVSERYQITEDRAFDFLVRASQSSNVKLRLVAEEIVATTNEKYDRRPAP